MTEFLRSVKCKTDIFPTTHGPDGARVEVLPATMPLKEALLKLVDMGVPALPVMHPEEGHTRIGYWFSILDIVASVTKLSAGGKLPEEYWALPISQAALQTPGSNKFITVKPKAKLLKAAQLMVQHDVHYVVTGDGEGSDSDDEDEAPMMGVISDERLGRVLLATGSIEPTAPWHQTLRQRGLVGKREPIYVTMEAPVVEAFQKMSQFGIQSVAVVEHDAQESKVFTGTVAGADLARLMVSHIKSGVDALQMLPDELKLSVRDFMRWRDAADGDRPERHASHLVYATGSMTVEACLKLMVAYSLQKLPMVNGKMEIVGIVTLNDLISQYLPDDD